MSSGDEDDAPSASLQQLWTSNVELLSVLSRKDMELASLNTKLEDEQGLVAQLQKKIKELQVDTGFY